MIFIAFILAGYLLATWFLKNSSTLERIAYTLFFTLTAVPFVAVHVSLIGSIYLSKSVLILAGLAIILPLAWHGWRHLRQIKLVKPSATETVVLTMTALVAVFAWFYYTNEEFLLSLASYVQRGEAKCFYMQTFQLVDGLNGGPANEIRSVYQQISTPGNGMFTSALMPLWGTSTFHGLYVCFTVLLFLFVYLLMQRWSNKTWLACLVAWFAVVNPYSLSVEVLDRNAMAMALSAVLFYSLFAHPEKRFVHGLVWGIAAGVGLRFLHLTLVLPIFLVYLAGKARLRDYALLLAGFVLTFTFNLPHLSHHGFHSLGETQSFAQLLFIAATQWIRTPFLPYPNAVYYFLHVLAFLGLISGSLIVFGIVKSYRLDRKIFLFLLLSVLPTFVVLAAQQDWIEADKARIFMMSFLPLVFFWGIGLQALLERKKVAANGLILAIIFVLLAGFTLAVKHVHGQPDEQVYQHKKLYQQEMPAFIEFYRNHFAPVGLLPNYHRLYAKLDFSRKRENERLLTYTLFARHGDAAWAQNQWLTENLPATEIAEPLQMKISGEPVTLLIDFEKLVTNPQQAVVVGSDTRLFADLTDLEKVLDIYHKQVAVSWQSQALPITILTDDPALRVQKVLFIELNAFISYGQDEYGFEQINTIHLHHRPAAAELARTTAMTALPWRDDRPTISLRVPDDLTIVVRDWIVNGNNGTPYRVDSWVIENIGNEKPDVEFYPLEPESYL